MATRYTLTTLFAVLILTGCGRALSDAQAQALADARAGEQALATRTAAQVEPTAMDDDLTAGVAGHLVGALANVDLPAPTVAPEVLASDPQAAATYAAKGEATRRNPPAGASIATILGIGAGALAAIGAGLKFARNLPGVAGIAAGVANMVWQQIAPDKAKDADDAHRKALGVAVNFGAIMEEYAKESGVPAEVVATAKKRVAAMAENLGVGDTLAKTVHAVQYERT